eukprot:3029916-Heterocapsa_arctica.AAC.1
MTESNGLFLPMVRSAHRMGSRHAGWHRRCSQRRNARAMNVSVTGSELRAMRTDSFHTCASFGAVAFWKPSFFVRLSRHWHTS